MGGVCRMQMSCRVDGVSGRLWGVSIVGMVSSVVRPTAGNARLVSGGVVVWVWVGNGCHRMVMFDDRSWVGDGVVGLTAVTARAGVCDTGMSDTMSCQLDDDVNELMMLNDWAMNDQAMMAMMMQVAGATGSCAMINNK